MERTKHITVVVAIIAHAVFLIGLGAWLWSREHYQFFPLVLIGAGYLIWDRIAGVEWRPQRGLSWRVITFGILSVMFFAVAVLLQSNLFGVVAAMLCAWTLIWHFGGKEVADHLRGPFWLLCMALPIPLNYDLKLIIWLQKVASIAASRALDLCQIRHSISGVILATEDRSFMVAEACSGVHSLFSCLCAIVFVSVYRRYSLIRILINAAQTCLWVIIANALRVFIVVYAFSKFGIELDSGWRHEALGMLTYTLALLMSLSTDMLFNFTIPLGDGLVSKGSTVYNEADNPALQLARFADSAVSAVNRFLDKSRLSGSSSQKIILAVLFLIFVPLSTISYGRVISRWISAPTETSPGGQLATVAMSENLIPDNALQETIDGWKLSSVERFNRDAEDAFGAQSIIFNYSGRGMQATFSIDGYYQHWHDLAYCYSGLDWEFNSQTNYVDQNTKNHATALAMYTDDGRQLLSHFSCLDYSLTSIRPGDATLEKIYTFENLLERIGWGESQNANQPIEPPVIQLQLTCQSGKELLQHEKESLKRLFSVLSAQAMSSLSETTE